MGRKRWSELTPRIFNPRNLDAPCINDMQAVLSLGSINFPPSVTRISAHFLFSRRRQRSKLDDDSNLGKL